MSLRLGLRPAGWIGVLLLAVSLAAVGAGRSAAQGAGVVSEVRVGVMAHDIGFLGSNKEDGADLNAEVLFAAPALLEVVWSPMPHVGVDINTAGDTSQVYFGLTWRWQPFAVPVWGALSLGGAVHDGETNGTADRKGLGSRILFREALELGYDLTPAWSASIYYSHISNANIADQNEGLNNAGLRVGYRF